MNFIRRFNINCIRNISRLTSEALLKKHIIQPVYISKQIAYRKNSSYVSSVSTDPDAKLARDEQISDEIIGKINTHIKEKTHGRLFAIIHLHENRYKITNEDIIAVDAYFPANIGDKICLEKILLVGCSDFTLLGRPLLHKDLVRIEATVIEKTFIVPRPLYRHGRVGYKRLHWFRTPYTLIRINSIDFKHSLDELPEVEGLQDRVIY
ncbi:39S ribosomal protein L21, mitochondrial-like isoform X1 [Argiope bruennichi]|uniref:39S ribosomal protein L21, mitochondrial-like isoform X1 n=1 Tax=Argiope bruennichi TaxID=94029 RepID=UPI002495108B|nr:39S ribosomal protein L21, mitochondrial-like isoform X1 [Argiope bruennichi]